MLQKWNHHAFTTITTSALRRLPSCSLSAHTKRTPPARRPYACMQF
nr:MAG TPA: hypothetical protein [Caudoviricetes sp.]